MSGLQEFWKLPNFRHIIYRGFEHQASWLVDLPQICSRWLLKTWFLAFRATNLQQAIGENSICCNTIFAFGFEKCHLLEIICISMSYCKFATPCLWKLFCALAVILTADMWDNKAQCERAIKVWLTWTTNSNKHIKICQKRKLCRVLYNISDIICLALTAELQRLWQFGVGC